MSLKAGTIATYLGEPSPLGATVCKMHNERGVNFSVFSKDATQVELMLFRDAESPEPFLTLDLEPMVHRQGHYWFIFVANIGHGQHYGYRVRGPHNPRRGQLFDAQKLLVDPYARAIERPKGYDRVSASMPGSTLANGMKSVVVDANRFDWQDVPPPRTALANTVIYELHVRGFTQHPNSNVKAPHRGCYLGLLEKIPYLKSLGITAVELMPIQQFDPDDAPHEKQNYWGYSPINFFAPHNDYASDGTGITAVEELKMLIRELHKAKIEVYLDVVFNHTCEGDHAGPTLCFKGFQAGAYYMINNKTGAFSNFSGCGNTCNANFSIMRRMIIDALHFWVEEMHIDGFRFDLASVLARDGKGKPMQEPPLLWSIDSDPVLCGTKIIAEAWDAAGLYQVGSFIGDRWNEWNGRFRDDVRQFWRGDQDAAKHYAPRLIGSPDIYAQQRHSPQRSINFVAAHDGFTLNDLVCYEQKHNLANGENNRDGDNHNLSANYGFEGPTQDVRINNIRLRQIKNMLATVFSSLGTPMLTMGDEVRRTQGGNNNAYCQDNEISWFDWSLVETQADLFRFVKGLIALRRSHPVADQRIHRSLNDVVEKLNVAWHGIEPNRPDWAAHSHVVAVSMFSHRLYEYIYFIHNAYWDSLTFTLPHFDGCDWHLLINTANASPEDIYTLGTAPKVTERSLLVTGRSFVALVSRKR
ncbi:Glycogen operon protein GlgX [Vibrio stylophorae]|uniref:Glycogen operon protein GlgX n=1 Tax=Vibrio stylophorae TaxID=659351 RepID=A0ABM8ZX32_9VIBR|nr:glycogen debranching protein GlgX [Vibrio stylophorae]CAH0535196.1 Glycogen operon protein GlgX [Vibrio stylophorae]